MHNLYANFVKILDVCKKFSANLVKKLGNINANIDNKSNSLKNNGRFHARAYKTKGSF